MANTFNPFSGLWDVYKTYYEIAGTGDKPRELVARGLTYTKAKEMVEALGSHLENSVGYSHGMFPNG